MNQWIDSFLKFTSIKEDEIYSIAGSASIEKLNKFKKLPYKVYIASHDTIKSYYDQAEWTNLNTLLKKLGIGIKIFDEAHVHWINIFYVDCFSKVRDNVYLTATPSRSDHNENRLYNTLFGDIQIHGLETKFNKKYIRCIAYQWNSHPSIKDKASMMNNHGFNLNAYNDYLLDEKNKDDFFSMLLEILESILAKDNEHKVAIVVNCNNMISELYKFLQNHYDKSIIGRFCGLVAVKDREKELDKQIILTTMKGFNKGVDVAGLSTLINTVNFSSETLTDQLSGRLRFNENYKSWFIDVIDMGFSQQRNNFNKRKKFLNRISKKNYIIEYNL
jgi:superfamily II DNA or RNA helicase